VERIVLGYDGSPAAVSALNWTAARAARGLAKVDVVLVVSPFTTDRTRGLEHLGVAETFLLERLPSLEVELHRLEGAVTESIAEAAEDADLVVIGINPGHPIRAAAAGWTPLRLSTRATAPVCMIPPGWIQGDDPVTVGVASDDSSGDALTFAATEAVRTSTGLRLVHSWLMPTPDFNGSTAVVASSDAVIEDHRNLLENAVQQVAEMHPTLSIQSELIRDSRSAALLRFEGRSSLIVIGSHRRGVLIGSLLGSVGREIMWQAECPICVVPPGIAMSREGSRSASQVFADPAD
jgi:nucleotide-binding universal stress UspA family protein